MPPFHSSGEMLAVVGADNVPGGKLASTHNARRSPEEFRRVAPGIQRIYRNRKTITTALPGGSKLSRIVFRWVGRYRPTFSSCETEAIGNRGNRQHYGRNHGQCDESFASR